MSDKSLNQSILKSLDTLGAYLENSGFDTSVLSNIDLKSFDREFSIVSEKKDEKVHIVYQTHKSSLNKKDLELFVKTNFQTDKTILMRDYVFIIVKDYSLDSIRELLKNEYSSYYIKLYTLKQLQFNILKHSYVPKHEKLTKEDKQKLFKDYNITKNNQLPEIGQFDPVACAIFLKPGDVCKIERYDQISYKNNFYRICVP